MLTKIRAGIFRWLRSGYDSIDEASCNKASRGYVAENAIAVDPSVRTPKRINFSVISATGGTIFEVRNDSDVKGPSTYNTYVCPEGDDIVETLSKIVTLESMR